jgi:hypothetical protein
MLKSKH